MNSDVHKEKISVFLDLDFGEIINTFIWGYFGSPNNVSEFRLGFFGGGVKIYFP